VYFLSLIIFLQLRLDTFSDRLKKMEQETPTSIKQDLGDERDKSIAELTRTNGILKANISTLYRTARAEIARKNDRISELQSELDNLLFKRMNRASQAETSNK